MSMIESEVYYPESDGNPIAENTLQFDWLTSLKYGFDALFADNLEVFVAGDLLWYPVEGDNKTRVAPDILIAFGRPKGRRGSYQQWRESGIAPQVVWEILSPGNSRREMVAKQGFYERYGVQEFYQYDPETSEFWGVLRDESGLLNRVVTGADLPFASPWLGVRFERGDAGELVVVRPDGERFTDYMELLRDRNSARERSSEAMLGRAEAEERAERLRAERDQERKAAASAEEQAERLRAERDQERKAAASAEEQAERLRAERDQERKAAASAEERALSAEEAAERLRARLRAMGIDPDTL